jgi:hydrogenase maturation protease
MKSPKVICCGNPWCGDDAAGIEVGALLRSMGIEAEVIERDAFTLLELWKGADEVLLIDAVVSGAEPGAVRICELTRGDAWIPPQSCSTHRLGVAEAIAIGRNLGRLPRQIVLYGIEAGFAQPMVCKGAQGLSPAVARAVEQVAREIAARVRERLG